MSWNIQWLPPLNNQITAIREKMENRIWKAILRGGYEIAGSAKRKAPWDTGLLRSSIDVVKETDGVLIGTNVFYAKYLEFGTGIYAAGGGGRKTPWAWRGTSGKWEGWHFTRGIRPKPFLRPAFEENIDRIKNDILRAASGE